MEDKEKQIQCFIEKIKTESAFRKIVKIDLIEQLIKQFDNNWEKKSYSTEIANPLEIALQFYQDYNEQYYYMIINGIKNQKIIFTQGHGKSFVNTKNGVAEIRLHGNDGDLFIIVHELAHFIDRNTSPQIVPGQYWFLAETFSFYMEKILEGWLGKDQYQELISVRENNRMYAEMKMVKAIENELYYEALYKRKGNIEKEDIDFSKMESIMQYRTPDLVNYLITYPLANILSEYLLHNDSIQQDKDLVEVCMGADLYKLIEDFSQARNKKEKNNTVKV